MSQIELGTYLTESNERYHACIEACVRCWIACESCASACLGEENVAKMVDCIRTDLDCAAACRAAIEAMVRNSDQAAALCRLCADACERCAEECGRHDHDHCQRCAEACRQCAEECRKMAA